MTPDDINNNDDFEEDFDVEEDFDDGLEEDWADDDLDDGIIDDIPDMPGTETSSIADTIDSPEVVLPAGEKTFLQKFFIPVVVGIVALFGLLFAVGSGLLSGSEQTETPITQEAQLAETQQNIPPPADPVTNVTLQDELPDLPTNANSALPPEEPLTPLPGAEPSGEEESFELVDLEAELQDDSGTIVLEEPPMLIDEPQANIQLEAIVDNVEDIASEALSVTADILPTISDMDTIEVEDITASETTEDIMPMPEPESDSSDTLAESALVDDVSEEPQALSPAEDEVIETLDDTATQESQAPDDANDVLTQEITESRQTIEALRKELADLKATIDSPPVIEKIEEMPVIEKIEPPAVVDVIKETKQEAAKVVSAPKKKAKAKKAIRWILRSAQPGKATIAQAGSNDMRTVEIGQTVSGLGRIKTIQVENGLWVVRGTRGRVSQ